MKMYSFKIQPNTYSCTILSFSSASFALFQRSVVPGDALQLVNVVAAAFRTDFQVGCGVLVTAFEATVAVVVH